MQVGRVDRFSEISAKSLGRLRRELREKRKLKIVKVAGRNRRMRKSWRDIAEDYPGVNHATLRAILEDGRDPKDNETRSALGLPTYHLVIGIQFKRSRNGHTPSPAALYLRALKAARRWLRAAVQHAGDDKARRESARMIGAQVEALIENVEVMK